MVVGDGDGFPQFAQLPPEIRQQVWKLHFTSSPRIHILQPEYPGPLKEERWQEGSLVTSAEQPNREVFSLTWTTIDAATNRPVPEILCINREAFLASKDVNGRERILSEKLQDSGWDQWRQNHYSTLIRSRATIDMDWKRDLVYIYDPTCLRTLLVAGRPTFARKIQHLAITAPSQSGALFQVSRHGPYKWAKEIIEIYKTVRTIAIVTLPLTEPPGADGGQAKAIRAANCPRDAHGFTGIRAYYQSLELQHSGPNLLHDTRTRDWLVGAYNQHRHIREPAAIRHVVDADIIQTDSGKYHRRFQ